MTALWIILGAFAGLLLLISLLLFFGKAGVRIQYDGKLKVTAYVFAIPISLAGKEKEENAPKNLARCRNPERVLKKELKRQKKAAKKAYQKALEKKKRAAQHALQKEQEKANQPSLGIHDHLGIILEILKVLRSGTKGRIRVRIRQIRIRIATGDAAKTAILYGAVLQSASYLIEWVNNRVCRVCRKSDALEIIPDYLGTSSSAHVNIHCSMRIFQLAMLAFHLFNTHKEETEKAVRRAKTKARTAKQEVPEKS